MPRTPPITSLGSFAGIQLSGKRGDGKWAFVDFCDADAVNAFTWSVGSHGYPEARERRTLWRMHRFILIQCMGVEIPKGHHTDHYNRDSLDCRRANIRIATPSQNQFNRKSQRTDLPPGVSWDASWKRWVAYIHVNKKRIQLGYPKTLAEAIALRKAGEEKYYGAFRRY